MSDIKWHYFPEEKPNYGDLILWLHWQAINKPPDVIIFDRETEWIDGDRWAKINDEPKRKPLPDGTLPMTDEEKYELCKMMGYENISEIFYDNKLHFKCFDKGWRIIVDVKAILYLATLFDLEV